MPPIKPRTAMPAQDPSVRRHNFDEVALGFNEDMAVAEAERCLLCKKPGCCAGCPVDVKIGDFIDLIKQRKFIEAYLKVKETNSLPAICGRVCPQEEQCEKVCSIGKKFEPVAIGRLERFVSDYAMKHGFDIPKPKCNGRKVAIVGSGPAGLTCAGDLALKGYDVTIFEALHAPGGVLIYGIPEFRLPKEIVYTEVKFLQEMGVKLHLNVVIGRTLTLEDLFADGFEAIFCGTGAGLPKFLNIPGETLNGVFSANEYLTRSNLMKAYLFPEYDTPIKHARKVAVVGAGNVAMDCVRSALRHGADDAFVVYRRTEHEMTARKEEFENAIEEGVIFNWLTNPVRIIGNEEGWVTGLECMKMELGEPDESGRRRPVAVKGSNFVMECDMVVIALGTSPNPLLSQTTPGLKVHDWGGLIADEATGATTREGVWAGGDAVTGSATVILAMGAGKKAATAIDEYLKNKAQVK
jgi:glutamate synthase (NADPH/NADH) small chain